MDRRDLMDVLDGTGIPAIYGWWEQGNEPQRPYLVLNYCYDDPFCADNARLVEHDRWQVDLVTSRKDESSESSLEAALETAGLMWTKYQDADPDHSNFDMIYRFSTFTTNE